MNSQNKIASINRIYITFSLILIIILALIIIPEKKQIDNNHKTNIPGNEFIKPVISEVIDGDTFKLNDNTTVRLIGVDTPEKGEPFYQEALLFADSVLMGNEIILGFDKQKIDKYERLLVYLTVDTLDYNELILKKGLASVYLFKENVKNKNTLIAAQKYARENSIGIWSLPKAALEDFYVRIENSLRFHRNLCPSIKNSNPARKLKIYDLEKALDLGYSPCRNCRP